MFDTRMHKLVAYAKQVEGIIYRTASSTEKYSQLLAEKVYDIHIKLEEKRSKRKISLQSEEDGNVNHAVDPKEVEQEKRKVSPEMMSNWPIMSHLQNDSQQLHNIMGPKDTGGKTNVMIDTYSTKEVWTNDKFPFL